MATSAPQRPRQELIRYRLGMALSQEDMAQAIGLSRHALVNAEDGGRIRLSTARKIAAYWERPPGELFPELLEGLEP